MTLLKRLVTAMVLFVFLFVFVYFGICIVGAGLNGAYVHAGNANPQEAYETGHRAGAYFVRHNLRMILLSSFLISLVASIALSFSGILPWCRKPAQPPPLPAQPPPL
jgi:quinol-cytochrome oxidoreductase complex cytochrome b subunit